METIDVLIRQRAGDHRQGLVFGDRSWTHHQVVQAQADRAAVLASLRQPGPFHVALLMENVPEYVFWMGAAALAGAVVVGGNPTHRGDELARDLSHTECQLLVTNADYFPLVDGYDLGPALPDRLQLQAKGNQHLRCRRQQSLPRVRLEIRRTHRPQ